MPFLWNQQSVTLLRAYVCMILGSIRLWLFYCFWVWKKSHLLLGPRRLPKRQFKFLQIRGRICHQTLFYYYEFNLRLTPNWLPTSWAMWMGCGRSHVAVFLIPHPIWRIKPRWLRVMKVLSSVGCTKMAILAASYTNIKVIQGGFGMFWTDQNLAKYFPYYGIFPYYEILSQIQGKYWLWHFPCTIWPQFDSGCKTLS